MKRAIILSVLLMMLLLRPFAGQAQFDPKKVCRFDNGKAVYTLDKRWTAAQRKQISRMFSIDSTVMAAALSGKTLIRDSLTFWTTRKVDASRVELTQSAQKDSAKKAPQDKIFLLEDRMFRKTVIAEPESVPYGVNRLTRNTIVQLAGNRVRFFIPGNRNARKIYLSGTFNAWSTLLTPFEPCDSGWTVTIPLNPGRYAYKLIIDGKWSNDPFNKLKEDDLNGGSNNIFFVCNYRFTLNGYADTKNVSVAGSFNNWKKDELRMIRIRGTWTLPLFLRQGTHSYKFVVDGDWITDPANKVSRPDGRGNFNSFLGIGDTLFFSLKGFPKAEKIIVAGDFNGWNEEELAMTRTRDGWILPYVLAPGNYHYKFIVDGHWILDPANHYTTGTGEETNSWLAVSPNYWFRLEQHSDADKVIVTGSFNGWDKQNYRMDEREGTWWFPVHLKPGKYTYKFIVDNKWIVDPANTLWEENEYGTGNSVLWIGP